MAEAIALRERAFDDYVDAGRCDDAARVAVWVAHQHMIAGRTSAGRGWLARCERALDGVPPCAGLGWISVERARQAHDVQEQIAHATRAVEAARAFGHGDLEVYAVSLLGGALVSAGRLDDGMRLLDEAMAAAAAGRVRDVHTLASAYCNLVVACTDAGEWERATEWCELVETFARTNEAAPLLGACRTVHADVLMANGHWDEAEHALESAMATNARYIPEMNAPAIASLAELRVQQGRLPEAEELLAGREEHPATLRALALLRLADDRPRQAVTLLERGLRGSGDSAVAASALLTPLVDARLALGDVAGARAAADELGRFAESSGIRLLGARAAFARSLVALAAGEQAEALEAARRALAAFRSLLMPLDAGLARLTLARAISEEDPESAREEARAALAVFRELGASRAARRGRGAAAPVGRRAGRTAPHRRRTDGARTGGPRAHRARDVERGHRPGAGDQRADRRPPRQPDPDEAGCAQPRRGRRVRRARASGRRSVEHLTGRTVVHRASPLPQIPRRRSGRHGPARGSVACPPPSNSAVAGSGSPLPT